LAEAMIIDGHAFAFRAFFGCSFTSRSSEGIPVNALYGFGCFVVTFLERWDPQKVSFVFDRPGPKFRNEMFPEYKAQRPKAPDDLIAQLPLIMKFAKCLGFPVLSMDGVEADDVIASLAIKLSGNGDKVRIMSPDKDFCQILDAGDITLTKPPTGCNRDYRDLNSGSFRKEYGFAPPLMVDYLALLGDRADNVPGVRGIGVKGASALVGGYGCLEDIYANLSDIAPSTRSKLERGHESAFLSRDLIKFRTELEFPERCSSGCSVDTEKLKRFCSDNNVGRLYEKCMNCALKPGLDIIEEDILFI